MSGPPSPVAGRYRLDQLLGRGGMGAVWEAYDLLLRRRVAAKEICYPDGISDVERERLSRRTLREARAVAAIDDPHAVRVYDIAQEDGRPWIVMELVKGHTLTDEIRARGALPAAEVARIGLALVDALEAAHRAGVLHRDIKPSNVLLAPDGRVKLTDFGIAAVDDDESELTSTGLVMGSPGYLAPERACGGSATPASDWWSLGATLWTAAEGRPPYRGATAFETMTRIVAGDPPPCERCDPRLASTLRALMAREPGERPTPREVRRQLRWLDSGGVSTVPAAAPTMLISEPRLPESFDDTTVLAGPSSDPARPDHVAPLDALRWEEAPDDETPRRRRGALVVVGLAVVVAGLLAAIALASSRGSGGTDRFAAGPSASNHPRASASSSGAHSSRHRGGFAVTHTSPPVASAAGSGSGTVAVPAGWQRYTDPTIGWKVAVPAGWTHEQRTDGTTVFRDPAGGRTLLIGTRYPPGSSALSAWQDQESSFAQSHTGYQRIRLENVSWRNFPDVADWEFTYFSGGAFLHAVDRGAVINRRGYGLFFQTRSDQWAGSQSVLRQIYASFQP